MRSASSRARGGVVLSGAGSGVVLSVAAWMAPFAAGCLHAAPAPAAGPQAGPSGTGIVATPSPETSLDADGPECRAPGPTVEATPVSFSVCGRKPPMGCQLYDLHIRNEGPDAWLFLEGTGTFPLMTSKLVVERNVSEPSIYRWSFEGLSATLPAKTDDVKFGEFRAFYVGAGSNVTIKDVMIPMNGRSATASMRFVDRLVIARTPATDWLGHDATLPLRGEATLQEDWERVIRREVGYPDRAVAELHVLCIQRIGTSRSIADADSPVRGEPGLPAGMAGL